MPYPKPNIRVHTDFCIQNSKIFPDFFQNNTIFFQTQGWQIGDQQRPWKTQDPSFFMMNCKHTCAITTVQCRHKRTYCSFEKKKKKFRPLTIPPDFFQVWKIAGQTLDLFANSRLHTNPVMKRGKSNLCGCYCTDLSCMIFWSGYKHCLIFVHLNIINLFRVLMHSQQLISCLGNEKRYGSSLCTTFLSLLLNSSPYLSQPVPKPTFHVTWCICTSLGVKRQA